MDFYPRPFDREFGLRELLSGVSLKRLGDSLTLLLGGGFRLVSDTGEVLLDGCEGTGGMPRAVIRHDLEPLGYLESPHAGADQLRAAASLLEFMMQVSARYYMASELHIAAVQENYEELQQQHAALVESDARYRALSESLEQRVQEQVKVIESAHRQLYQAEKMASVGQLAAGVAHEINNPIGFIRSNLGTAQSYVARLQQMATRLKAGGGAAVAGLWQAADMDFVLEDFGQLLGESKSGADRVARIVADLKGFSSVDRGEEEVVNLNDSIRAACNVAAGQLNGRADVILELGEIPALRCRPGPINQVFLNLLLNAAHAMERPGAIRIHTGLLGDTLRVRITDTGSGIPEAVLPRIFDPFFTTRDVGRGTGLGLTVSRDTVTAHGGTIEVESRVGEGTTVTVSLPVRR